METYGEDLVEVFFCEQLEKFPARTYSLYEETGMLWLDLMPMNNGQEQEDALLLAKSMQAKKDSLNSHTGTI